MLKIIQTKAEYEEYPVGLVKSPRFSWKLESQEKDTVQTSFRLEISKTEDFSSLCYQEERTTEESQHQQFPQFSMESLQKYFYRIQVTDNHGETSAYSKTGCFVTALLDCEEWQAKRISAETEEDWEDSKGTYLRKKFQTKKQIQSAYVCATAWGLYQLFVNGQRIGTDEMTPGWTSYDKHLCYQTYEVTQELKAAKDGKQCMGALLGAGWYKGKMGFFGLRNNYGKQTSFLCQLTITYTDGSSDVICSDESWEGADAPVLFAEIYDGEIYDARKELVNWCDNVVEPTEQAQSWRTVSCLSYDKKILYAQAGCKPAEVTKVPAKQILKTPQGDTVIDFGQNMAGWIHVKTKGKPREKIELDCFETLDASGNVYLDNLRGAKQAMVYYCNGSEGEYHPHFTYMGFRYALVKDCPYSLTIEDVTAYAVHTKMEKTGDFTCSNPDLNQLWSNILWGLKSNFLDIPTDCPQRNERVGWTGDAQIFCRTASYLMNTYLFFEKWLIDVKLDQTPEGGVPHVVPDIVTPGTKKKKDWLLSQGTHSAAAWADVAVLNPWNLYLTFGDQQILIDQYDSMKAWIHFMETHANGVIWNYKLQFGDWVALDAEEGSYYGATPNDLTCTAYYAYSTGIFAKIAEILGKTQDAKYYRDLEKKIKTGFADLFFDKTTKGMTVQTQTAHIIALYFNLTPEEYKEKTVEELLVLLAKENGHLVTGFVGTPYFTHALSQNGHLKEAYELLLKDDFPSWLYQVKKGATTVWEHWDGLKPDGTMWSADMNSFNHYAYGAIGEWLIRVVAGIEVDETHPGYQHICFYPRPGGGLQHAAGTYESVYGTVFCGWKVLDKNQMELNLSVPVNTTAELRFDQVAAVVKSEGLSLVIKDGICTGTMGSGTYHLVLQMEEEKTC